MNIIFMRKEGLEELILDNATCQDGLKDFIENAGFKTPGFACARKKHKGGYPQNSPDCMMLDAAVFGRCKVVCVCTGESKNNTRSDQNSLEHCKRNARSVQKNGWKT